MKSSSCELVHLEEKKKKQVLFFHGVKVKYLFSVIFRLPLRSVERYNSGDDFIDSFLMYVLLNIDYVKLTMLTERLNF